jgi:aspartyl-tRNA(Asn)/glutamyl-tRNA(Gln) amidotransferase subunit C
MEITDNLIDNLCDLSRLKYEGVDREAIKQDLTRMLAFVEQVQEVDTEGVEPLIHITQEVNRWREDEPRIDITHEEALLNAPQKDSDFFRVPKFVEK